MSHFGKKWCVDFAKNEIIYAKKTYVKQIFQCNKPIIQVRNLTEIKFG